MKAKFLLMLALLCCWAAGAQAQTYNMSSTPVTTCSGTFYDGGGSGGNYNDYTSYTQTFTSGNGNRLLFAFSSYNSYGADILYIYDGPNNTYPLLAALQGNYGAFNISSTGSALTFIFTPNNSGTTQSGWAATISCTTAVLTDYNMNSGTITACSGVFYDNGGSTASYPNNENRVQTFCSGTTDYLQFVFTQPAYNITAGDSLFIYDGATTSSPLLAVYTAGSIAETVTSTGTCMTFRFKSDGAGTGSGWQAVFNCVSSLPGGTTFLMSSGVRAVCSGSFYDDGGAGGNYNDYAGHTQTFYSYNGNRISFNFTSFNTYGNDILYAYDGPNNTYPLIGAYAGSGTFTVTSTGNCVTFIFAPSSSGTTLAGWAATISCAGPTLTNYAMSSGTVTACSGVFTDNGGSNANYPNNENRVQTFCSGTTDYLQFVFTQPAYAIAAGDSLFIYDGATTSSSLLAVYTAGSIAETVTSTGTCMTFRFKSDGTGTASGWQAVFNCVSTQPGGTTFNMSSGIRAVCSGSFYDDGGSGGNYNDYAGHTQTFYSYNGDRISFNFTSFNTYGNDILYAYDGPNNTYPLIGVYAGSGTFTVTSTGNCVTFVFSPSSSGTTLGGWAATISCVGPTLPSYNMNSGSVTACSGVFYDNGGSNVNYPNNENRVQTFCSGTTDYLQFVFTQSAYAIAAGDSLFIYDGATTSSPLLAVYTAGSIAEMVTSTGTCMTFRFKSDGAGTGSGWQAVFNCVSTQPAPTIFNMSSGIRAVCSGTFYDDGGSGGNYNDYASHTQTFYSYNGNRISFNFTSYNTYGNDILYAYDGPNNTYPLIGVYAGSGTFTVTSTGNCLTFVFAPSNAGSSLSGWQATISCVGPTLTSYNMNSGTVTACSGVFYDNGGPNANYPNNENRIQTFCSGTSDYLQFVFTQSAYAIAAGDSLFIYDGATTSSTLLAVYTAGSIAESVTSTGTCMTFRFKSDGTGTGSGWQAVFNCVSTQPAPTSFTMSSGVRAVCSGTFYDDGGSGGNYNDYASHTQTFYSYNGDRISFNFTSFNTYGNDILYAYDGPNNSYPLIGVYAGSGTFTVTSTGNCLTFVFAPSNAGSSLSGWQATISCVGPTLTSYSMNSGTITACSGVFYDNGGPNANYPNNENRVQTFCSGTSDYLQFVFTQSAYAIAGSDSLFIYDGATTSSTLLAVYTAGSIAETVTSTGTCLTFRFKSDGATTASGWQAVFNCVSTQPTPTSFTMSSGVRAVCSGTFYDDGGAGGYYNDYASHTQTFYSYNGNRISFNFTSFNTYGNDILYAYDGPNNTYPLIGVYAGSGTFTVTSTGNCVTFVFVPSNAGSSLAGWNASISCAGPVLASYNMSSGSVTACSGVFYDNGGPGASYPNNENRVQTFCSGNGQFMQFIFNQAAFGLSGNDSLFIYDGASTSAQPIAVYTAGSIAEAVTSTGTCLTFRFKSDGAGVSQGWQAQFNCTSTPAAAPTFSMSSGIRYTCGATFYDDGGSGGNYNDNASHTQTFISTGGCAIRATFTSFVTYSSSDYLRIYDGPSTASPLIGTYSYTTSPGVIQASGPALTFQFITNGTGTSLSGWVANLTCPSQAAPPVITTNSPVCEGSSLQLNATNSTPGVTYNWSGPNGFISSTQNPAINPATLAAAGTYSVTATISGCTSNQSTANVTVSPMPAAPTVSNNGPLCSGSTLNLTTTAVTGATAYSWTGPNSFTSAQQNPSIANASTLASGTYTVTATAGACNVQGTTTVSVTPTPGAPIVSSNSPLCSGNTLTLSASAASATSYSWSGPNGFTSTQQNPSIVNATTAASGTYTVTAVNGSCTSQATVNVTVNNSPAAPTVSSNSPVCAGSSLDLSASTVAGATYSWSGPNGFASTAQNPSVANATTAASGTYTVTATVGGCSVQSTTTATVNAGPAVPTASSNGPLCAGNTLTLSASAAGATAWSWSGPNGFTSAQQNPSIANATTAASGTYTVTASNGSCSTQATVSVTVNNTPGAPVVTSNSPVCENSTINLSASTIAGASYSWSGPGGFTSSQQNPSITSATLAASGTYTVTASIGGCTAQSTTSVTVNAAPSAPAAGSNTPVCSGSAINLTATTVAGATYSWSGPNGFTSTQQNPVIASAGFADAGTYSVTATVSGCSSTAATTNVIVNTIAPVASSNGPVCSSSTINLFASSISGASYSWSGPNGFVSTLQNPFVSNATTAESGTYTVTAAIGSCVSQPATVSVTVNTAPATPSVSNNGPLCAGSTLNLTASSAAGATYSWSGPNGFSSSQQNPSLSNVTTGASGTYTVTASVGGCTSAPATTTVAVNNAPSTPVASANDPVCSGSTLNLYASTIAGATYSWSGPNGFISSQQNPVITNVTTAAAGTYTVTATVGGCSSSSTVVVTIYASPAPPVITWDQNFGIISSSYPFDNQWYLSGNPLAGETWQDLYYTMYSTTGPYTVVYTDMNGCSSTSAPFTFTTTGVAEAAGMHLEVYPNPNDGTFIIELRSADDKEYTVTITDAIGQVVYSEHAHTVNGSYSKSFEKNDLAKGVYTLSIRSGEGSTVKMIIIQ